MATLTRPGVYVDASGFPTYASATPGTAAAAFMGWCPRGPLTPTFVSSWKNFTQYFGGFDTAYPPSELHLAVFSYFSAGGTSAVIIRAVSTSTDPSTGTSPVIAESTFNDRNTPTPGPTLGISAANTGAWGNDIRIDIQDGTLKDDTLNVTSFTIVVKYKGTAPGNKVETWPNMSMVPGSTNQGQNNYALDIVNSPLNGSNYIRLTDLSQTPPNQRTRLDNPVVIAGHALTGGLDGRNPDSPPATPPALSQTDIQAAVTLLDQYPDQPFVLNVSGEWDPTIMGSVIGYAEGRGDIFVVYDPKPGLPPSAMESWANTLTLSTGQAAIYYPEVIIADPYSSTPGQTRTIAPGGFVVGRYITTDLSRGVAKAPAGLGTALLGVYGLASTLTNDDQGSLTQANVNCLISVPGSGVIIWGARTLSPYLYNRYVPVSRTLIYLQTQFVALSKFAVFEPNDWVLWNQLTSILDQFLSAFWQSGGLQGLTVSDAYYIICDNSNNRAQTIDQGIVNVEVGVALQKPAEFVVIQIGQWAGGQSVTVTTS